MGIELAGVRKKALTLPANSAKTKGHLWITFISKSDFALIAFRHNSVLHGMLMCWFLLFLGQVGAIRLAISRALLNFEDSYLEPLQQGLELCYFRIICSVVTVIW